MNNLENIAAAKINYLTNEFGMNKKFIAKKIGFSRVTVSYISNKKNEYYQVANAETLKKMIKELNEKFPMCENVG